MPTSFAVDVRLNLLSQLGQGMQALNSQLQGAQRQVDSLGKSFSQLFAFKELERAGKSTLGFVSGMVKGAADLQAAMINVKTATNASTDQMQVMHDLVIKTSQSGLMSSIQAGDMVAQMARGGFSLASIQNTLPKISQFADVMQAQRKIGFDDSTKFGIEIGHFFGAYTDEKMKPILDTAAKVLQNTIATPQELYTQTKGFGQVAKRGGMTPESIMMLAGLGLNLGDKSFGVEMANMMIGSIPQTASLSGTRMTKQLEGLQTLGLVDKGGKNKGWEGGKLQWDFIIQQIAKASQQMPADQFIQAMTNAFNRRGARGGLNLADPSTMERMKELPSIFAHMMTLQQQHDETMKSAQSQWTLLESNLQTLGQVVGDTVLPSVTKFSAYLAGAVGALGTYVNTHESAKKIVKPALEGAAILGAGATAVGAAGAAWATLKIMGQAFRKGALPVYVTNQNGGAPGAGGVGLGKAGSMLGMDLGSIFKMGGAAIGMAFMQVISAAITGWKIGRFIGDMGGDALIQKGLTKVLDKNETEMQARANAQVQAATDRRHQKEQFDANVADMDAKMQMVLHGDVHVHADSADTAHTLTRKIFRAATRSSGTSRSSGAQSPYSSNNKGQ